MDTIDNLQETLQGIEQKAKEQGLYVVRCNKGLPSSQSPNLIWQGEWAEYLEIAGLSKTILLYLQAEPFDIDAENKYWLASVTAQRVKRMRPSSHVDVEDVEDVENEEDW